MNRSPPELLFVEFYRDCGEILATGYGPYDHERLCARRDGIRQRSVRRFVGQILPAGEESHECSALLSDVVADRAAQHRIAELERVEKRALGVLTRAV